MTTPYLTPRDTWEAVKRARGWTQYLGETVEQMDARYARSPSMRPDRYPGEHATGPRVVLDVPAGGNTR